MSNQVEGNGEIEGIDGEIRYLNSALSGEKGLSVLPEHVFFVTKHVRSLRERKMGLLYENALAAIPIFERIGFWN